ncbi:Conserved Oligomeric Golgi Complex Subunit 1 [Manis pentadactyla]|nr:Conserved Oligomeric Golgi Complex Subunit 1 [Manis pentadactyla]
MGVAGARASQLSSCLPALTRVDLRSKPAISTSGGARRLRGLSLLPPTAADRTDPRRVWLGRRK